MHLLGTRLHEQVGLSICGLPLSSPRKSFGLEATWRGDSALLMEPGHHAMTMPGPDDSGPGTHASRSGSYCCIATVVGSLVMLSITEANA